MTITRRFFIAGAGASAAAMVSTPALARCASSYYSGYVRDNGFSFRRTNFKKVDKRWHKQFVKYFSRESPGTIVIDTKNHFLYYIWENQTAIRYGVGVGREGFKWYGRARINHRALWPRWVPPKEMRERHPELPESMDGGPANPLGPRALYLYDKGGDTGYRVHGTTDPCSIGTDASSGCIRMFSEDVIDLYQRVPDGTRVSVLKHLGA